MLRDVACTATGMVLLLAGERVALSLKINRQVGGVVIGVVAVLELDVLG